VYDETVEMVFPVREHADYQSGELPGRAVGFPSPHAKALRHDLESSRFNGAVNWDDLSTGVAASFRCARASIGTTTGATLANILDCVSMLAKFVGEGLTN
jgi:hypothetical protein